MTFFVPYDDSTLARQALQRASELATGQQILVATVVPKYAPYAREKGWLDDDEEFDAERVEARLREAVHDIAPAAELRCEHIHPHASAGDIVTELRDMAREVDADVVFLGSENVGSIAAPVASIGSNVATRVPYDIYLVQNESTAGRS
jgi:nucleotide-binding universal stress UspA family protein